MKKIIQEEHLFILLVLLIMAVSSGFLSSRAEQKSPEIQNPLIVDTHAKTVTIYTEINGKYFTKSSPHLIVFKDGGNADKSLFRSSVDPQAFHAALIQIGATPGNNLNLKSPPETVVEGSELDVKFKFGGTKYSLNEVIGSDPPLAPVIRFGGYLETQTKLNTGCILCLHSCPAGITSNAKANFGCWAEKPYDWYGKQDMLPGDGEPVFVTFSLK